MAFTDTISRLLPKNRFARSVSVLAGGTAAGQAVVVLASPLLTRLYTPEDFGVLAVYASLLAILGVVASLRYQLAIPLPESDEEAAHVFVLSLLVVVGMTVLIALIILAFGTPIVEALNTPTLAPYLWLLPVGLLLVGVYQVLNYWAIRTKAFPAIARTKLTQAVSMVSVQLGAHVLGPLALLLGQVVGQAAGSMGLGTITVKRYWPLLKAVQLGDVIHAVNRYRHFPIFSSWAGALNTVGSQLPPVLFAALFSTSVAGIYMLAHRVLAMPMTFLGAAIADVFLSSAVEAHRKGRLAAVVARIHAKLAHIAMPPLMVLALTGPELFSFVFGANWSQAGTFVQWMAPWIYLAFITSPLSRLFTVLEKQFHSLLFHIILTTTRVGALIFGSYQGEIILAIIYFSITSALCYLGLLLWIVWITGNQWRMFWQPTGEALAVSLVVSAPMLLSLFVPSGWSESWTIAFVFTAILISIRYMLLVRKFW